MASVFTELQIKYKGVTVDETSQEKSTTIVWQGSKQLCEAALESNKINTATEYGNVENIRMYQEDGDIWNVEIKYAIDSLNNGNTSQGSAYGPKSAELTVRMISIQIQSLKKYKRNWNYNLYTASSNSVPSWWYTDDINSDHADNVNYAWGTCYGDLPSGIKWKKIKSMTKPGVENRDYPVYEITERSKHSNQSQAAWVIAKRAGRISNPDTGDFGIVRKFGGNWLCEGGSVVFDGKYWVATCSYIHSPAKSGWDKDLYDSEID